MLEQRLASYPLAALGGRLDLLLAQVSGDGGGNDGQGPHVEMKPIKTLVVAEEDDDEQLTIFNFRFCYKFLLPVYITNHINTRPGAPFHFYGYSAKKPVRDDSPVKKKGNIKSLLYKSHRHELCELLGIEAGEWKGPGQRRASLLSSTTSS